MKYLIILLIILSGCVCTIEAVEPPVADTTSFEFNME